MKKQTVLVTGGAGFIGFHLIKSLLKQKKRVICIDNFNRFYDVSLKHNRIKELSKDKNFILLKGNICKTEFLKSVFKKYKIDIICHLAALAGVRYSITFPKLYEEINVRGTINLLEIAKNYPIKKIVFASSAAVYGENTSLPFKENDLDNNAISMYGITKKQGELLLYYYHKLYHLNSVCLRFFTVYGPFGRPDMAIYKFTNRIKKNKYIEINNYGKMTRDFIYVEDIVKAINLAIKKNIKYDVINIGTGKGTDLLEIVKEIEKNLNKKAKKKLLPYQKGEALVTIADTSKAKRILGFKASVPFKEGVRRFFVWYKNYYNA